MAAGKLYGYSFAKSQFFPTTKEFNFNLTIMVVETSFEKVPPTQSQLKSHQEPNKIN